MKKTFAVLSIIILSIISYFLIRGDVQNIEQQKTISENKVIPTPPIDKSNNPNQVNSGIITKLKAADELLEFPPHKGLYYNSSCGKNVGYIEKIIAKFKSRNIPTAEQLDAIERILNKCNKWYSYYDMLSAEDKIKYESDMEVLKELNSYFSSSSKRDKSKLSEARSVVATGGDKSNFSSGALRYLLAKDRELLLTIAEQLNIKDTSYIKQSISNIASLYNCETNREECAVNSFDMQYICMQYEICGVSFQQYTASRVTPNHYADLLQIVNIIRELVRQGYFDEYPDYGN